MSDNENTRTSRPPRDPVSDDTAPEPNSLFDKVLRDGVKRGLDGFIKDGKLKSIVGELKMPREIVAHIMTQVDETKQAAIGVIAREVRVFLEKTNLADELARLLTQISFQIKTEIRFIPNDQALKSKDKKKKKMGLDIRSSWWPKRASEPPLEEDEYDEPENDEEDEPAEP